MNTEDIKYCIEEFKPESFPLTKYPNNYIHYRMPHREHTIDDLNVFAMALECHIYINKLFLQEVIEGINKAEGKYYIELGQFNTITVVSSDDGADFIFFKASEVSDSVNQAKEKAIKYIIDQLRSVKA